MDSYDGYGSPGKNRDGDSFSGRTTSDAYRRWSPSKPLVECLSDTTVKNVSD